MPKIYYSHADKFDYNQIVSPFYREEAAKAIKDFFKIFIKIRAVEKELATLNSQESLLEVQKDRRNELINIQRSLKEKLKKIKTAKLTEPRLTTDNLAFQENLTVAIITKQYHLANYTNPDFSRHVFALLRRGKISQEETMTAIMMYEGYQAFGSTHPSVNTFKRFSLKNNPGIERLKEQYNLIEAEWNTLIEKINQDEREGDFYTISLSKEQEVFFLKNFIMDYQLGKNINHSLMNKMLRKYNKANVEDLRNYLNGQEVSASTRKDMAFIVDVESSAQRIPFIGFSKNDKNLSFFIPTMETLEFLEGIIYSDGIYQMQPTIGEISTRYIRAGVSASGPNADKTDPSINILSQLFPHNTYWKGPGRPIYIAHPDIPLKQKIHGSFPFDIITTAHDIGHAARANAMTAEVRSIITKLSKLYSDPKYFDKPIIMSKRLWEYSDLNFSIIQETPEIKKNADPSFYKLRSIGSAMLILTQEFGQEFETNVDSFLLFLYAFYHDKELRALFFTDEDMVNRFDIDIDQVAFEVKERLLKYLPPDIIHSWTLFIEKFKQVKTFLSEYPNVSIFSLILAQFNGEFNKLNKLKNAQKSISTYNYDYGKIFCLSKNGEMKIRQEYIELFKEYHIQESVLRKNVAKTIMNLVSSPNFQEKLENIHNKLEAIFSHCSEKNQLILKHIRPFLVKCLYEQPEFLSKGTHLMNFWEDLMHSTLNQLDSQKIQNIVEKLCSDKDSVPLVRKIYGQLALEHQYFLLNNMKKIFSYLQKEDFIALQNKETKTPIVKKSNKNSTNSTNLMNIIKEKAGKDYHYLHYCLLKASYEVKLIAMKPELQRFFNFSKNFRGFTLFSTTQLIGCSFTPNEAKEIERLKNTFKEEIDAYFPELRSQPLRPEFSKIARDLEAPDHFMNIMTAPPLMIAEAQNNTVVIPSY